jgi:alpha-beta hydrolase superfamily lysophospholipase
MTKTEFHFLSKDGKTKIHGRRWLPDDGVVYGVVQLVHGMQEYIDRYDEFAGFLTGHGLLVVGHDHLGHGSSVRDEKHLGYFCKKHPSDVLVDDMHQLTRITKNEYPNLPYVIFGHSMGSYLLRKYLSRYSGDVDGAILCGTGSVPDSTCLFGMAVCQVLAAFRGWHYRSEFVRKATFGKAYAMYDMDGTHPENSWISRNVESVKAYYADSLCSFRFTLNGYYGLFSTVRYDNQPRCLAGTRKDLPIYIISGSEDSVGDHGAGVKRVYRQYKKAGFENVTMKLYEGARHELINETNRAEVYADIWSWLHREIGFNSSN